MPCWNKIGSPGMTYRHDDVSVVQAKTENQAVRVKITGYLIH